MKSIKEKIEELKTRVNSPEIYTIGGFKDIIDELFTLIPEEPQQPEVFTINGEVVGVTLSGISIKGLQKIQIVKEVNNCDRLLLEIECEEPLVIKEESDVN